MRPIAGLTVMARLVYFHHRSLFSGSGWRALTGDKQARRRG